MKKLKVAYIALCMILCSVPLFGMIVRPTTETTENRRLSEFPSLTAKEGGLNLQFFSSFEKYFTEHFAFRNELVAADGKIQSGLFGVSSVKNVICGTDGWLYYTTTLPDYSGTGMMSERELTALQNNLSLVSRWLNQRGTTFVFTAAPNKNTLYGEHMPYYASVKVGDDHTLYHLSDLCGEAGIPYADVYAALKAEDEVLYLKRDSHWNNKGALLAYRTIMDRTGLPYDSYANVSASRRKAEDGDLNRMLYSYYGEKEVNYYYDIPEQYTYVTDTKSVEDGWIETAGQGTGTLLMFRDSFGNTLLPYVAGQFEHAWFSKEAPYRLENILNAQPVNTVIFEKVERNLRDYITAPPILSAPVFSDPLPVTEELAEGSVSVTITENMFDPEFWQLSGTIAPGIVTDGSDILVSVDGLCMDAYDTGENGFTAYLKKENWTGSTLALEVLLKEDGALKVICRTSVNKGE
ncbi:MAG: hypothetical protein IKG46_11810 [Solobacterium sp.]|nr:hypothetical protein [Solobacterium sp.]